jgi:hypothetical protein
MAAKEPMAVAEIIDLERFRTKIAADQGFRTWLKRFQEQFGPETRLKDLGPQTLLFLATPGEETLFVYFDLIMGAQGFGGSARFRLDDLDSNDKLKIMDTAFALMDRVRFEVMRRLGWVEAVPEIDTPIITLVRRAWRLEDRFTRDLPRLASGYPDYQDYVSLPDLDQGVFIRRLIPKAVVQFRESLGEPQD